MKTKILIAIALFISSFAMAQNEEPDGYDVEGFCIGQRMNYKQFVAKFGKPDRYENDGSDESYYIGEDYFHFEDNGIFLNFIIESNRFAVLTKYMKGGIRAGDKLSKLDNFKYGKPVEVKYGLPPEPGVLKYALFESSDCPIFLYVKAGVIITISYFEPL